MNELASLDVEHKDVLLQMALDVPLRDGVVDDDTRLRASIPTIRYLLERNCRVIIVGHVGRPKGKKVPELSTKPVADRLQQLLATRIQHIDEVIGGAVQEQINKTPKPGVVMLENIRYEPGEEEPSEKFADELASLADVFINDDYPDAHRANACNVLVPQRIPSAAGLSMIAEVQAVSTAVEHPEHPLILIIGGAKADKIGVINHLIGTADKIIVGGVLANTFLKAHGNNIQASKYDDRSVEIAGELLRDELEKFLLPVDVVVANDFSESATPITCDVNAIPEDHLILDIGPRTREAYAEVLRGAKTVVWGGPIGVYEWKNFSHGTEAVARAVAAVDGYTLVAGGDSGDAVNDLGLAPQYSHVSIGGGATLKLVAGAELPAVTALKSS